MVIIVKKLVPVYKLSDEVPKKYRNLRKAVYVATFKHLYTNISKILTQEYGLDLNEKIVVFWMREISLPRFARYRLPFRKVYSGVLNNFEKHCKELRDKENV